MGRVKTLFIILVICCATVLIPSIALAQAADFTGDIYVYNGQYTIWDGAYEDFDVSNLDLVWHTLDSDNPLTSDGEAIDHNLYIMDEYSLEYESTYLYFGDLNLGSGGLYCDNERYIDLHSGTLKAAEIVAAYEVWIEAGVSIFVSGNFTSEYEINSYGCTLDVGGNIQAPYVYFDSDDGQVFVTVGGDIIAYDYDQEGGSVTVDGDIKVEYFTSLEYPTEESWIYESEDWTNGYNLTLEDEYSDFNFIELNVGGSILVTPDSGSIFIGCDEETPSGLDNYIPIVLNVAGDMVAGNLIEIYEGTVTVDGAIETTNAEIPKTIYIYGGNIKANEISSATDLIIGDSENLYGLNDNIIIDVATNLTAAYEVVIFGGNINVGGEISTLMDFSDTIYILGGSIDAEAIDSATSVFIGDPDNYLGTNDSIYVDVNSITAAYDLYIYGGVVSADTVSCTYSFNIYDSATLFDAVAGASSALPFNYDGYELNRTVLSGLIPNSQVTVTVDYYDYDYTKTFTATADENGEVYVWLVGNSHLGGTAVYSTTGEVLSAESMVENLNDVVTSLSFFAPQGYQTAEIGIDVPDAVYSVDGGLSPWGYDPFSIDDWNFTDANGESVTGFSDDISNYSFTWYRNGVEYNNSDGYIEGDYVLYVTSEQIIGETTYIMAGCDQFTIAPLIITVKADNKNITTGGVLPEYTVSISDNGDGYAASFYRESASEMFYADCYASITTVAGRYPIYARANCEAYCDDSADPYVNDVYNNPYFYPFASDISGMYDWGYSIQYNIENGVLTVSSPHHNSGSSTVYYTITSSAGEGGSISPSGAVKVAENTSKTFTITADEGYVIDDVLVDGVSVGAVSTYSFSAVTAGHTIEAKFVAEDAAETTPISQFSDLDPNQWYYEGVGYVLNAQLFNGTSETAFAPDQYMTRAMLVTVLYRLAGSPAVDTANPFDDVAAGQWYSDAITWAAANGIVMGYSSTTFGPDDYITREQLAIILYNYAKVKGYDVSASSDLSGFADLKALNDAGSISTLSLSALKWAVGEQLITGVNDTTLDPQGYATRAQVAVILMRFAENIAK